MPNLTGLVSDPQFLQLSPADQQATMGAIDPEFGKLNSNDFGATVRALQAKGISQRPPGVTSGAPGRVPVEEPSWMNSKPADIPAMGGKVPQSIIHSDNSLGDTIGGLTLGGTAALAGAPILSGAGKVIAKHPVIGGTIASELIHQARNIPYVGKIIPPYSEMLPFLLGGKGNPEAEPAEAAPTNDQLPGRPYMPDPHYERPVPEELPARSGPLLLNGNVEAKPAPNTILSPIESTPTPVKPADVQSAIEKSLGGSKLVPGVSLRNQPAAQAVAAGKLPEGFTPIEGSSALKGYKYNPDAREFESITQGGQHYVHGDVSPEDAKAFEDADSKGKAWQQIRNNPLVAKVVNGKRVAIMKSPVNETPEGEETPVMQKARNLSEIIRAGQGNGKAAAPAPKADDEDLTDILQQSLKAAKKKAQ